MVDAAHVQGASTVRLCAVLATEVDYCLCNTTAHVQSFPSHTLSNVNTVDAFNGHEVVASTKW